jgi:hypothetical protein
MQHSDTIKALAGALAKAQAEIGNATKNANNPHFKSMYADLAEVVNTVRPVLARHGLAVAQFPGFADGVVSVETILTHESGEWLAGTSAAPVVKADPQGVGSAITYLRRYSLAAVCGIAQEDDDGNAASRPGPVEAMAKAARPKPAPAPEAERKPWDDDGDDIFAQRDEQQPVADVPQCPKCGGAMWDNRKDKKNPKAPDFKCRDKECVDDKGFVTALWAA